MKDVDCILLRAFTQINSMSVPKNFPTISSGVYIIISSHEETSARRKSTDISSIANPLYPD